MVYAKLTLQALGYAILLGALIPFIRPRLPLPARTASRPPKLDWAFLTHQSFWYLWLGVLFQGFAAFMPGTYLPGMVVTPLYPPTSPMLTSQAYASALHLSPDIGTISIALMNLARVPGQVLIGYASDRMGARTLILGMAAASTISVYAGWGAATNTGGLLGFSLAFGGFAGR
jgi:hypothetical protein